MIVTRTYKFKLYKSKKNKYLHQQIDIAGLIYNHCIALHRRYYRRYGKFLNRFQLCKHITKLKKMDKYSHWKLVDAQAIQDIAERIDRAYQKFFSDLKRGVKCSPPKFKKVKKYKSFTLKQTNWKILDGNKVKIRGRIYKYWKSRGIPENVKTVTVKRDSLGDLYIFFCVQEEIDDPKIQLSGDSAVGFDFGLKTFLTGSDGTVYESPLFLNESLRELRRAQRGLSRKKRGSNNREKARRKVARIHKKITNQRKDYFFKLAREVADDYDYIFLEDLNIAGMQKLWGKKVGDLALSEFVRILKYVTKLRGKVVHQIGRFYPSSKQCHRCGFIYSDLNLSERHWACLVCQTNHDRDFNAAVNIYTEGASSVGLGDVRPQSEAIAV